MSQILLCNRHLPDKDLQGQCGITLADLYQTSCRKPTTLRPYTPYLVSEQPTALDRVLMMQLSDPTVARMATDLSLSFGADNTLALSNMMASLNAYGVGTTGAATSVYAGRVGEFGLAVQKYQTALLRYRDAVKSGGATKQLAESRAREAFANLQTRFQQELKLSAGRVHSSRGGVLTNPQRGLNIASSSRHATKLEIMSQVEATNLVRFSKYAKFLGNGLAVIDFGSRAGSIHTSYKAGENWERELFVQSSSFVASTAFGVWAVKGGLTLLVVATPVGWAGLIFGGLAVAGTAAGLSYGINAGLQKSGGAWYDALMAKLRR